MGFNSPEEVSKLVRDAGEKKANLATMPALVLGFLAGAYIAFGFLLDIRVTGTMSEEIWGSLTSFIGASVFALGLILVLIAGGELLTGNMMADAVARFTGKITTAKLAKNWVIIAIGNLVGSLFIAYFFGHYLGLTEGEFLEKTLSAAHGKMDDTFLQALVSGIGCNWLVCLAVWMNFAAKDIAGKILAIYFPIMAFVAIGFQHVVANMFLIPAAIFAGDLTWLDFLQNFVPVFIGNAIGGAIFVGSFYYLTYLRKAA